MIHDLPSVPEGQVNLAHEVDFRLGGARIRPSSCEVVAGGRRIRLQPRVMQVLVALFHADGEVVSRDAMLARCWGGVVLGDDSINRCVQRLRRLAETDAPGAFAIETLPRVGYRLTPSPAPELASEGAPASARPPGPWLIAAMCVAVGAGAAIAALVIEETRPARWVVVSSRSLVSTPLVERHPALSPNGAMLAYSAGPDIFSRKIYLKGLSGGEALRLTNDAYDDVAPTWSPDGGRIAFVAVHAGEPCRIMVVPVPAGLAAQVGRCQSEERSRADWNRDGDALLFVDSATPTSSDRIMRLDLATGRQRAVTHPRPDADDWEPAVSRNGQWVAFLRSTDGEQSAFLMIHNLNTGEERKVSDVQRPGPGFAWAPDSSTLFVADHHLDGSAIWAYPIAGGPRALVTTSPMEIGRLAAGSGGLLAAEIYAVRLNAVTPPHARGAPPVVIDPANGATRSLAYSTDGTLAEAAVRSGENAIWLINPGASARKLIGFGGVFVEGLTWSPDGAHLACLATTSEVKTIRVIDVASGDLATIPSSARELGQPAWTANGRALLFPAHDAGGWRLWRADLSRPAKPYPVSGDGWVSIRTSGDALFGVRSSAPGIWRIDPTPRLITAGLDKYQPEAWTVFKGRIIFLDGGRRQNRRLLSVPLEGGVDRPFADLPRAGDDPVFAVDPRSARPVYVGVIEGDTDIALFHLARS